METGSGPSTARVLLGANKNKDALKALLKALAEASTSWAEQGLPRSAALAADLNKRWIFFVDAAGVARVVAPLFSVEGSFDPRLHHWLTVFRDHGRPERDLPEVQRFSEEDEEGELPDGEDEED